MPQNKFMAHLPCRLFGETSLPCRLFGETSLPCRLFGETSLPCRLFGETQYLRGAIFFATSLLFSTVSQAQFLSAPQVLRESQFDYQTLAPASSTPNFLTQANAQGASRFAFVGDNAFGDPLNPSIAAIYGRTLALPTSYLYQTVPPTNATATLLSQLNAQAALGYRYFGDQIYGGVVASVLVKENNNATYSYMALSPANTEPAFLTLINSEGALGYQYQGNIGIDTGGGNFVFSSLFERNTTSPTTYSYESQPISASAAALVVQADTQGARQFLYRGGIAFGTVVFVSRSLYEKDNSRGDTYRYEQLPRSTSVANFLIQLNAQGTRRFRYFGDVGFEASETASLYASVAPILTTGFEN